MMMFLMQAQPSWVGGVPPWIAAAICGLIAWLVVRMIKTMDDERKTDKRRMEEHIASCNEIPKSTIIEKLESLCEKQDLHHEENSRRFAALEGDMRDQRKSLQVIMTAKRP